MRKVQASGGVILDFGAGGQWRLEPMDGSGGRRRGRPPSPATVALTDAMVKDRDAGEPRSRAEYVQVLRKAGHRGSLASASIIVGREARRVFGRSLARRRAAGEDGGSGDGPGRKPSQATTLIRERLAKDKAGGGLQDATHYVKWLVDEAKIGLKRARPIVYREMRSFR